MTREKHKTPAAFVHLLQRQGDWMDRLEWGRHLMAAGKYDKLLEARKKLEKFIIAEVSFLFGKEEGELWRDAIDVEKELRSSAATRCLKTGSSSKSITAPSVEPNIGSIATQKTEDLT